MKQNTNTKNFKRPRHGKTVYVENDNVQKAIKKFRRIIADNNILNQYYENRYFIKKSDKRRKKQSLKKFKIKCWMQRQKALLAQDNN